MANSILSASEGAVFETREDLVAAVEQGFAQQAATQNIGQLVLHGIILHSLAGDKEEYRDDGFQKGSIMFIRDRIAELAQEDPQCELARDQILAMTQTAYQMRRISAGASAQLHTYGYSSDEQLASRLLNGEFTFLKS